MGLAHGIVGTKQRQMGKGWNNFELLYKSYQSQWE